MSECNHDCSSCKEDCQERSLEEKLHPQSSVKHVIGIVSGKGGVGKSLVTALLAVGMLDKGKRVAILDADITGPSIPKMFSVSGSLSGDDNGAYPKLSRKGIQIVSSNLLLPDETQPIIWRGPIIANLVKQFWGEIIWKDVDYMFIDMPPGTGDVPLTVFQSIKVDGIIVVTSPQELVSLIVQKAVKMAEMMKIPVIGIVENMSYVLCPDCNKKLYVFGQNKTNKVAEQNNIPLLASIPIDQNLATFCDKGDIEACKLDYLTNAVEKIIKQFKD
ncbi:MAG: Mrp/NBP35 family ATP-binding protein [Clostridia bacterium]